MNDGNQVFPMGDSAALMVIEFPSFRDFIDAYSPIISEAGIFIKNEDVSESSAFSVGDSIEFEVRLKDDFRLIHGAGEVAWLGSAEAADGASGTAVRFRDVDEPSQRLIARLVGNYVRDGGKLFEIEDLIAAEGGEPVAAAGLETDPVFLSGTGALSMDPRLTAETLKAAEAEALFADDDKTEPTTLEIESISPDEVPPSDRESSDAAAEQASGVVTASLDDPVGLETIAIPSGLVASMTSAAEVTENEGLPEPITGELLPVRDELPAIDNTEPGVGSVLEVVGDDPFADLPGPVDVPDSDGLDEAARKAAADSLDPDRGGLGGIPEEIAQVAEEMSGVHHYDLPAAEEVSGATYAGSASAASERNTGGRIAALAVVAVLAGAGAFYFGDTIMGLLGIGEVDDDVVVAEMVTAEEAMPAAAPQAARNSSETAASGESSGVESGSGSEPEGGDEASAASRADSAPSVREGAGPDSTEPGSSTGSSSRAGSVSQETIVQSATRPEAAVVTPAAAPSVAVAEGRRVERITWHEEGETTVVVVHLNVELSKAYLSVERIRAGAPREVIKIQGIEVPYSPGEVAIGNGHVLRLRTGLHQTGAGSALHLVADLTSADVKILSVEPKGRSLEITFS